MPKQNTFSRPSSPEEIKTEDGVKWRMHSSPTCEVRENDSMVVGPLNRLFSPQRLAPSVEFSESAVVCYISNKCATQHETLREGGKGANVLMSSNLPSLGQSVFRLSAGVMNFSTSPNPPQTLIHRHQNTNGIMIKNETVEKIAEVITKFEEVEVGYIFGSSLLGKGADVDIALLVSEKLPPHKWMKLP
jgi:hypothetical protein